MSAVRTRGPASRGAPGFDYVVVGAGSAGCVVASRLAERSASVLLLEAGPWARRWELRVPAAYSRRFKTAHDWDYTGDAEPAIGGRSIYLPRAKVVGGCSAMNAMIYIRGARADYDGWAARGLPEWSYDRVLPYFLRAEDNARGAGPFHATGGPLRVSEQRERGELSHAFLAAGRQAGLPENPDFNAAAQDGVGWFQVTQRNGLRETSATAYLRSRGNGRPPAHRVSVRTGAQALRVLLDRGRAVGVRYRAGGRVQDVRATREVVVCAGAIGSPHLLLSSGIGPAADLESVDVPVVAEVPGVGANLQDHASVGLVWSSTTPSLGSADTVGNLVRYIVRRRGPFVSNVVEAGAFLRSEDGLEAPDLQLHFSPVPVLGDALARPVGDGFTIWATLLTPASRGRLRLRSADPAIKPRIETGYLREPGDTDVLLRGVREALRIAGQPALARHVAERLLPSRAAEADLREYVRDEVRTIHHPAGTCAMGDVVDEQLRVCGVEGLRVADASVMPVIPRGNTNAPTIMIGERAADLLSGAEQTAATPRPPSAVADRVHIMDGVVSHPRGRDR